MNTVTNLNLGEMNKMYQNIDKLQPWEALLKKIALTQLGYIKGKRILDFGSDIGFTANYYAKATLSRGSLI